MATENSIYNVKVWESGKSYAKDDVVMRITYLDGTTPQTEVHFRRMTAQTGEVTLPSTPKNVPTFCGPPHIMSPQSTIPVLTW